MIIKLVRENLFLEFAESSKKNVDLTQFIWLGTCFHIYILHIYIIVIMSLDDYKLSAELIGHSLDVRAVAAADKYIVSGSRDKTAKIWEYNG